MFSSNTLISGGTITQNNDHRQIHTGKGSFDRLLEAASPAAFHNSGDRRDPPKCHPNTRVAVLEKIKDWILSLDPKTRNSLIMWLLGPAGSGKSAIAQTIAEWAVEEGILLASYFFSRFDPTRNHPRSLIATIAYQAALYSPQVREHISAAIDADPFLFTRSLITQICTVIVEPLKHLVSSGYFNNPKSKRFIIIDGLDECEDRNGQIDILRSISKALQEHHLPLIFLVSSRPEHDITHTFASGYLRDVTSRLPLDDGYQASSDIKRFLQEKLNEIKHNHPFKAQLPPEWPAEEALERIVAKSSGQFIYAATVINFVNSTRHRPAHRLDIVLGLRPAASSRDMPFSELDALYHHVISCVHDIERVLQVLALVVLTRTRSVYYYSLDKVELILSLDPGDILLLFCDLHSVIDFRPFFPQHPTFEHNILHIYFLHASLEDFLLDESRSKGFYIDPPLRHAEFAQALFPCCPSSMAYYDLTECAYHLARAKPTAMLRQKILELDIAEFLHELVSEDVTGRFIMDIPRLIKSISESKFDDSKEVYLKHVRLFNTYAAGQLGKYYSDKNLMVLVAIISLPPSLTRTFVPKNVRNVFQLDEQSELIDQHGLGLVWAIASPSRYHVYLAFLQGLFGESSRLGIYAPDDTAYANGAVHFLRYICYHLMLETPRYLSHDKTIRRNNPWKWRRTLAWKKHAYKKILINTRRWWKWLTWRDVLFKEEERCRLSLDFLAKLLPRAARSEELIKLAERCSFGILSYAFLTETRVAKREVARYLDRMDKGDA